MTQRRIVSPASSASDLSEALTVPIIAMPPVVTSMKPEKPTENGNTASSLPKDNNRTVKDASQLKLSMLFDPSLPWILVENGSLGGHFDWVPEHFRVGGWSYVAIVYLTALLAAAVSFGVYLYQQKESISSWWSDDFESCNITNEEQTSVNASNGQWVNKLLSRFVQTVKEETVIESDACLQSAKNYPGPYSIQWLYNTLGCLWMLYVMHSIMNKSPMGLKAWGTYTVQSWTLLTIRHGLSSLAPFSKTAALLSEVIRFPAACSATVTFLVWNMALVPFIYFQAMDTAEKRKGFVKFCFSFRLVQIHLLNIVYCYLNIAWASPPRELHAMDFYLALVFVLAYMMFYLLVLDRIGIHLYPIFSPRLRGMVVLSWTGVLGLYALAFYGWKTILGNGL
ncbi:hypothetical protein MPSEU_000691000 [Mayamaea pseudoterrestris]|nr:hypothetical protein MPSEU_000691000 [Mayamaea pseudoterrestris]